MRQYFYYSGNIEKNYLASYAHYRIAGETMYLTNILTGRQIPVCAGQRSLKALASALERGCSDQELRDCLKACQAEHMREILMREGMIE